MSKKMNKTKVDEQDNASKGRRKFLKGALIASGSLPFLAAGCDKGLKSSYKSKDEEGLKSSYKSQDIGFDIHKKIAEDRYFVSKMIYDPVATFNEYEVCAAPALLAVIIKASDDIVSRAKAQFFRVMPENKARLEKDKYFVTRTIYNPTEAVRDYGIKVNDGKLVSIKEISEKSINRAQVVFSEQIRNDIAANNGACNACNGGCK